MDMDLLDGKFEKETAFVDQSNISVVLRFGGIGSLILVLFAVISNTLGFGASEASFAFVVTIMMGFLILLYMFWL